MEKLSRKFLTKELFTNNCTDNPNTSINTNEDNKNHCQIVVYCWYIGSLLIEGFVETLFCWLLNSLKRQLKINPRYLLKQMDYSQLIPLKHHFNNFILIPGLLPRIQTHHIRSFTRCPLTIHREGECDHQQPSAPLQRQEKQVTVAG